LLWGGDLLVRGAVAFARHAHVPPALVAASVVAFGTSVPELVVTVQAVIADYPGMALGNVVGSNIANMLLVGGAAAAVYPLAGAGPTLGRDSFVMVIVSLLFIGICLVAALDRAAGGLLLAGLIVAWGMAVRDAGQAQRTPEIDARLEWVLGLPSRLWLIVVFIGAGLVGLPIGANLVVTAAAEIAEQLGVSDTVIGLTILAFSTSLPELATTLVAAYQRRGGVALGTIVGSNTLNILGIMGVAAVVSPSAIPVPASFLSMEFPVMLGSALLVAAFIWLRRPIGRLMGILMVAAYMAYIAALFVRG
jgi:cation:H+ antiporter